MTQIKLKTNFPQVWGDLAFQNRWLRFSAILCLIVAVLALFIAVHLVRRGPTIIALDQSANPVTITAEPTLQAEVERAARQYVGLRYAWEPATQAEHLARARYFVSSQSLHAFQKTISDLEAFSKSKNIAQRVYPTSVIVDIKKSQVRIVGDRFTEIQGLKAATILKVNLTYQTGSRTLENPWGIYVVKEAEVQ